MLLVSDQWLLISFFIPIDYILLQELDILYDELEAIIELEMEHSDGLCLGVLWFNGFWFIKNSLMKTTWKEYHRLW